VTWTDLTVAGAFVVGVVAGGFAAIRITRYLLVYLRRDVDNRRDRTE
jgi:hypothetical protein